MKKHSTGLVVQGCSLTEAMLIKYRENVAGKKSRSNAKKTPEIVGSKSKY